MDSWKQALWLVKFELKAYKKHMFFVVLIYLVTLLIAANILEDSVNTEGKLLMYDMFFVIIFWFMFFWTKPKEIQYQKMDGDFWGSPYFVMLKQLPIPKDILIKSRFLQYYVISVPAHLLILIMFFISSAMIRDLLSLGEYISFSLIWMSLGVAIGSSYPASDPGEYISKIKLVVYTIITFVVLFGGFIALHAFTGKGLVYWTIMAASKWSFLSALISISVVAISLIFWPRYMSKRIERADYYK